jgi:septin 6/8/11
MKKLESKVNIIPVIAKADTITKAELQKFKAKIMSELTSNGVQIYNFPTDDESVADTNKTMNVGYLPSLYQSYLSFILALTSTSVNV